MTEQQIKESIETGTLKIGFWSGVTHYFTVVFMFFIPCVALFLHLKFYLMGQNKPFRDGEFWFFVIPPILGVLSYFMQRSRLKLTPVDTTLSREELHKIIEKVAKELEWVKVTSNHNVYIAKTDPSFFSGSWGEQITILFDHNRILVNSICRTDKQASVVSMGRNRQNVNTLKEEVSKAGSVISPSR